MTRDLLCVAQTWLCTHHCWLPLRPANKSLDRLLILIQLTTNCITSERQFNRAHHCFHIKLIFFFHIVGITFQTAHQDQPLQHLATCSITILPESFWDYKGMRHWRRRKCFLNPLPTCHILMRSPCDWFVMRIHGKQDDPHFGIIIRARFPWKHVGFSRCTERTIRILFLLIWWIENVLVAVVCATNNCSNEKWWLDKISKFIFSLWVNVSVMENICCLNSQLKMFWRVAVSLLEDVDW